MSSSSTSSRAATIRDATLDDLSAIRAILVAHGNDGPVVNADVVGPYISHQIRRGRARVSLLGDDIVGFGAAIDAGRAVHLADLFVRPDRVGQGIGRPLLDAVLDGAAERTTFASDDPRALPLYVRAGMQPLWAGLYVQGASRSLPKPGASLRAETATSASLSALEVSWTGHDRTLDHAYWAGMAGSDPFVVKDAGAIAGFGYARVRQQAPIRVLDRFLVHADADPVATLLAGLTRAAAGGPVLACLLGPNPALRPLLEAGFRVVDRDQFLATDAALVDPVRLLPNPGML
jgi:GNAT superfamily N-acetyltransferase